MKMKIGDRVRLLRGTEEGIIVNIRKDKIVEIEIEDGFIIPALKNEVAVIDQKEREAFGQSPQEVKEATTSSVQPELPLGIHLAISEEQDGSFHGFMINQTENPILYTLSVRRKKMIAGISFGIAESGSVADLGDLNLELQNRDHQIIAHCIIHEQETKLKKLPITSVIAVTRSLMQKKELVASIGSEVAIFRIDSQPMDKIDPQVLKDIMVEGAKSPHWIKDTPAGMTEDTVDLHIDRDDPILNPNQILEYQIEKFEKAYDRALLMNLQKLKIIHGVGTGILRNEIHRRLSKKQEVKYFEDGDKERFGFGSTIIYF